MQAACPQCAQTIKIDDAKVPDKPFSVKCPKCQNVVRFPGKGAAAPAPAAGGDDWTTGPPAAVPSPQATEHLREEMAAQLRKDVAAGKATGRALVALTDRTLGQSTGGGLTQVGYNVESMDNPEEGGRLLEQGVYDVVVTNQGSAPGKESLVQRIARLNPEARRRIFLVLLGDEFRSGDGTQAWALSSDMVINTRDAGNVSAHLATTMSDRQRMYQVFLEARRRWEAAQ